MKSAYLFPGQGSQHVGMGKELFHLFPNYVQSANKILGYSIEKLCLHDEGKKLSSTEFTQPALYTVNILTYLNHLREGAAYPDYLAGHSLGEYCALFAAGVFSFETGLKLVKKRGELMSKANGGGMAAVLGCDSEDVERILNESDLSGLDIANYNSPEQTVLSGPKEVLTVAEKVFSKHGANYIALNVSAPFHSRYMENVKNEFKKYLNSFDYLSLKIPVVANVTAKPYQDNQVVENLTRQISGSVQWVESVRYMAGLGEFSFKEMGPGTVLTKLTKTINQHAVV